MSEDIDWKWLKENLNPYNYAKLIIQSSIAEYLRQILGEKLKDRNTRSVETEVKEEVIQDFENVTIMTETEKAYLVVKNGYQMWVAKSNLEEEYELGSQVDLKLTAKAEKWMPKKSWDKYVPAKKR